MNSYRLLRIFCYLKNGQASDTLCKSLEMFCPVDMELWLKPGGSKYKSTERSRSHINVIHKGHRFVELDLHLLLLNKHKKFENYAIARFCSSDEISKKIV